jgi:hypothetical protein
MKVLRLILITSITIVSCERDFDINIKASPPQLVVEAYINNEIPLYNYVILGRSQDYYTPDFENTPVTGAMVSITEGTLLADNTYQWDARTRKLLKEAAIPGMGETLLPGVYFDTTLVTNPAGALRGRPGKHYLLEIEAEGKKYTAVTALLQPVQIDTLTVGNHFTDVDEDTVTQRARITVHYKDPDTIGNTQMYYWQTRNERLNLGWGGMETSRFISGTDDLVNGQYIGLTMQRSVEVGDTVLFHMISVERKVYNFWDSFNKARSNGGPFATPVKLLGTVSGENVIGCFSGFSLSSRVVIIR